MEEPADELQQRFLELCQDVNMDKATLESAWQTYNDVITNYTLEGEPLHWLVCALFAACRQNLPSLQTVSGQAVKSNCVSLSKLLQKAKFSFTGFLKKISKWLQMSDDDALAEHVRSLECNFRVSTIVFKKYLPVFKYVFLDPVYQESKIRTPSRPHRNHRQRKFNCLPQDVFNFCWMVFIYAKGTEFRPINDEVLPSFQLLLSAINLCYKNVLLCPHRSGILNPNFPDLPDGWDQPDFVPPSDCDIISTLVREHVAHELNVTETEEFLLQTQVVNTHKWGKYVDTVLKDALSGDARTFFLPEHFESNMKKISNLYEEYVLTEGDFDETVFLHKDVDSELGTPIKNPLNGNRSVATNGHNGTTNNASAATNGEQENNGHNVTNGVVHRTPLTNRQYLIGKDRLTSNTTYQQQQHPAVSACTKLKKIIQGKKPALSAALKEVISDCSDNVEEEISQRVTSLEKLFKDATTNNLETEVIEKYCIMTKILYYHLLDKIMAQEKRRLQGKGNTVLAELMCRGDFNSLLYACCMELVLMSSQDGHQYTFPWVLSTLEQSAYYFYKVIELVIRAEESLSGDLIKHLSRIEEEILGVLAWTSDSPLWDTLDKQEDDPPRCEEVNHAQHIENPQNDKTSVVGRSIITPTNSTMSPLSHPRLKQVVETSVSSTARKLDVNSVTQRFSSPSPGSAKRRLFAAPAPTQATQSIVVTPRSPKASENGISSKTVLMHSPITGSGGGSEIALVPVNVVKNPTTPATTPDKEGAKSKPKKTGSLALFYRKVYHLCSVRLRDLCELLVISIDVRSKIWTCFEYSLSKKCAHLMQDRHVDQLLMCAVYVIAKITQHDQSFQEIMRCYRSQPQANSSVYRNVLINRADDRKNDERDDLIQFYNKIYVPVMRDFVKKFNTSGDPCKIEDVPLSPMPRPRAMPQSPRRVTEGANIYVSPLRARGVLASPSRINYNFQRSPAKQLRDINSMMKSFSGKRSLAFNQPPAKDEIKRPKPQ